VDDHVLSFRIRYHYESARSDILVPVVLSNGTKKVACSAKLDTGAPFCIFHPEYAQYFGLDVKQGFRQEFGTLTAPFTAYGHELTLEVLGLRCDSMVFFYPNGVLLPR
jgi:hypothetical protein